MNPAEDSLKDEDLRPICGQVKEFRPHVSEWYDARGRRHISVNANCRMPPYVRQTQKTKYFGRAKDCNSLKRDISLVLRPLFERQGIQVFRRPKRLGFSASFSLKKEGQGNNPERIDLSNLLKSCEDILQGLIYENDVQIWKYKEIEKYESVSDSWGVAVWELEKEA